MSVYTTITRSELQCFLENYPVGNLTHFEGIRDGIINTNYFATTQAGDQQSQFVLTIFETLAHKELPYFLDLMAHLSEQGLPTAHPIADNSGAYLTTLKDKPAALVQRLSGRTCQNPTLQQCAQAGSVLGQLHKLGASFKEHRDNDHGAAWRKKTAEHIYSKLSEADAALLTSEIQHHEEMNYTHLPRGVIHADFFSDNVLFDDGDITGVIDFYFACDDYLLYDLAIAVNDWCKNTDGSLKFDYASVFIDAYHQQRPLVPEEKNHWVNMLRMAALRFWLSRLYDLHFPREGDMTFTKNPDDFKHALQNRIATHDELNTLWPL